MFAVIYTFKVKEGMDQEFRVSWRGLTKLIYQYEGSLGSRLHISEDGTYIAYAQWPDKETWENSGANLPAEADTFRNGMRACCDDIQVSFELSTIDDLLKARQHNGTI